MDVEGLLNLEDYVAPQAEKQIAKMPSKAPKYEMDPSFWELPRQNLDPPPLYEEKDPLAIEGPPAEEEVIADDEGEGEKDPNKILDQLDLPNYNDVEMRLAQSEMTATLKRNYLQKVIKDADTRRRQVIALKSDAAKKFNKGQITEEQRNLAHNRSDELRKNINDYSDHYSGARAAKRSPISIPYMEI